MSQMLKVATVYVGGPGEVSIRYEDWIEGDDSTKADVLKDVAAAFRQHADAAIDEDRRLLRMAWVRAEGRAPAEAAAEQR
jgi:hypothetical protein